jgi:hypothetical protein
MDAIVEEEARPIVLELKTSKRRWGQDQIDFDFQPTAYRAAARTVGYDDVGLELIVTTKGKTPLVQSERLLRHDRDERELAEIVFGVHRAVDAGADYPMRGWQCRSCPHADACGS